MGYGRKWMAVLACFSLAAGCARINTQLVEKPRVDQETQGNAGYLQGFGPASSPRSTTRQMIQTDIELPTVNELNPWRKPIQVTPPAPAAPEAPKGWEEPEDRAAQEIEPIPSEPEVVSGKAYTVGKGDTLEKISQKFYGTTKKWRRIYDANRNVLRSPNRVYPGQKLVIPSDSEAPASGSQDGRDFK